MADNLDRASVLSELGIHLSNRYKRTGNLDDLVAAINCSHAAVVATPEDNLARSRFLNNLGCDLGSYYEQTGNLNALDSAINYLQEATLATPQDHPERAQRLNNLGSWQSSRYNRIGELIDLEIAILCSQAAMEIVSEDSPHRISILNNYACHLGNRYERTGNLSDLETAISYLQAAVEGTPEDHPDRAGRLSNLGGQLLSRYERTDNLNDLEVAISYSQEAVDATPESHRNRAQLLHMLGNRLSIRYKRIGNLGDLEAAINHLQAAVEATPEDHPNRAAMLSNFGTHICSRFELTGNLDDLEAAISYTQLALEATPEDDQIRATLLNNLGNHLSMRYERTGNLNDLQAAIDYLQVAIEKTPEGDLDRGSQLNNLGNHLCSRYIRTGSINDLEEAISYSHAAVEATPEDHPNRACWINNLGNKFACRYERTGHTTDLETAIGYVQAAVEATPEEHPDRAYRLNNLGRHLKTRHERSGSMNDLQAAINHSQKAVEVTPENHPDQARFLNELGNQLSRCYEETGNLNDLEAAISYLRTAVQATPEDHQDRAGRLSDLGNQLCRRYIKTNSKIDLEDAVSYLQAAVEALPDDHPDQAWILHYLGHNLRLYATLKESARCIEVFQQSLSAFQRSWSCRNGRPIMRLLSALHASILLVTNPWVKNFSQAYTLLHDAINLIPLLTSRSLERDDQQHMLAYLTGLASLAAAVALEAGKAPFEALRLLELGRNVTNSQLLDYRSDISDLWKEHPSLAEAFNSLRLELDSPSPSRSSWRPSEGSISKHLQIQQSEISRRNQSVKQLDAVLEEIRQQQGFENFLRPVSEEYLLSAAQEGPIVVLNVTELRSDAIILTREKVTSIPLPQLSETLVKKYLGKASALHLAGVETLGQRNKDMKELITWLWDAGVEPVLRALGLYDGNWKATAAVSSAFTTDSSPPLPKIWWIGVGLMTHAPLHAAGKYFRINGRRQLVLSTLHFCIPSYTSTIRALVYSRSKRVEESQYNTPEERNMLIVAMPTTPGESNLHYAAQETSNIQNSFANLCKVHTLIKPTAETVLQNLATYNMVHFICHGCPTVNPADSHMLLRKPFITPDGVCSDEVDRLRVRDIAAKKLPSAKLAYLSVCSTAKNPVENLADEGTHIVSSFHIAGFRHVIGTLWEAEDEACEQMALEFYSSLKATDNIAIAYRNAVLKLREKKPEQPMYWAPFIHFGA